jgi:hypothetical protein
MQVIVKRITGMTWIAALLILLYSCEKPKNISLPAHQAKLVLHGYINLGDTFRVAVGKTTINLGIIPADSTLIVTNALVILFENGVIKDTLTYNRTIKRYESSHIVAVPGVVYKVMVQSSGFTTIEATATAPSFVPTNSLTRTPDARFDESGNSLDDITFSFTDPPAENNYYLAELNSFLSGTTSRDFCVFTYDPAVDLHQGSLDPFEIGSCINNREFIFSDRLFDGTTKELIISTNSNELKTFVDGNRIYRPYLKKYTISQDFFQYVSDRITLNVIDNNPFSQPYTIPGNVKNGYGLFTVFSAVTDTIR